MHTDAHQHFWDFDESRYGWIVAGGLDALRRSFLPEDLKPLLDANGIRGTVAVQARQDLEESEWLLGLAAKHPWILGVVGWVDLRSGDVGDQVARLRGAPGGERLAGIRHVVQDEPAGFMDVPEFRRGVRAVGEAGLSYDVLVFEHQLEEAVRFCRAMDGQRLVLDHVGKPAVRSGSDPKGPWARSLRELGRMEHVWVKMSGIVTEADPDAWTQDQLDPYLETVADAFPSERRLFGSDWPVCTLAAGYAEVKEVIEPWIGPASDAATLAAYDL